jgi:hypothetical protein
MNLLYRRSVKKMRETIYCVCVQPKMCSGTASTAVFFILRCSMYAYTRPRQQGSQPIHICLLDSTPSSIHTVISGYLAGIPGVVAEYTLTLRLRTSSCDLSGKAALAYSGSAT